MHGNTIESRESRDPINSSLTPFLQSKTTTCPLARPNACRSFHLQVWVLKRHGPRRRTTSMWSPPDNLRSWSATPTLRPTPRRTPRRPRPGRSRSCPHRRHRRTRPRGASVGICEAVKAQGPWIPWYEMVCGMNSE